MFQLKFKKFRNLKVVEWIGGDKLRNCWMLTGVDECSEVEQVLENIEVLRCRCDDVNQCRQFVFIFTEKSAVDDDVVRIVKERQHKELNGETESIFAGWFY